MPTEAEDQEQGPREEGEATLQVWATRRGRPLSEEAFALLGADLFATLAAYGYEKAAVCQARTEDLVAASEGERSG